MTEKTTLPYNIREKQEKNASYRSLIRAELADELYDKILNIIVIEKRYRETRRKHPLMDSSNGSSTKIEIESLRDQQGTVVTLGLGLSYQEEEINGVNVSLTTSLFNSKILFSLTIF